MNSLAQLDRQFVWHPFTQMQDWLQREPIVITRGRGTVLSDVRGRRYLDANSSIWTNLHGHNHPRINTALRRQLARIAHSSALGLANEPASLLAQRLVEAASGETCDLQSPVEASAANATRLSSIANRKLQKVFFSDDGSTALEVALKLAYEYARRSGRSHRPAFVSLQGGYHGDTVGAVALGHIPLFHKSYSGLLFKTDAVMAPYCYRCPFNRARPERADARLYRLCRWECVDQVERRFATAARRGNAYAGFVFEPLIQGAAGMIAQPPGWLVRVAGLARAHGALLIADEVLTGFGRTGCGGQLEPRNPKPETRLFACQQENVQPDFLCLAKGLTGGYLPMAATLTTREVFDAFLGGYDQFKTFFHGHSYTGNQLGAAAAMASLELLRDPARMRQRARLQESLGAELRRLWSLPAVGDIRQVGLIAGVELVRDWRSREPFALAEQAGIRVCEAMARRGVLTRPIGNVIVLMPPYSTTTRQLRRIVDVLHDAIAEVLSS